MDKNIHKGHRQRLKTRFLTEGLDAFEEHEVLELLLFYSIPMKDTNQLAHKILKEYGSLSAVFDADPNDLCSKCQISLNTAVILSLIPSLSRLYNQDKVKSKVVLNSSSKAGQYAVSLFIGRLYEVFYVISLDNQNKVNDVRLLHKGTINEAPVYPRLIVETALRHHASSVILAHNHPGGSLQPSIADIEVTKKIKTAMDSISIRVVDHIIVAGDKYYSFAENGQV